MWFLLYLLALWGGGGRAGGEVMARGPGDGTAVRLSE